MMIIVDTNIISEAIRTRPNQAVLAWLDAAAEGSLWTTSITIMELWFGMERLQEGDRRAGLEKALERYLDVAFGSRILDFDHAAARQSASLQARRQDVGIVVDIKDTMLAGIALAQKAPFATRNTRHFDDAGIRLINPFTHAKI